MEKNDNIIDLGSWNVPSGWKDLKLSTYQELERFYDGKDENFDIREVIHILCGKSKDEINMLPLEFLEKIFEKLSWLKDKPKDEEPRNWIEINGERYEINFMEKLKFGEYITADGILKNDKHNYAALLAVLCRKEGEVFDSRFEAEVFENRVKMFEEASVIDVLPLVFFFINLYAKSEILSKLYTMVEEAIDLTQQNIKNSEKLGVWKRWYLNWQVTRLRKSLESNKNISQMHSHSLRTLFKRVKWKRRKRNGKK